MLNMKNFQNGLQVPSCDQFRGLQPVYETKQNRQLVMNTFCVPGSTPEEKINCQVKKEKVEAYCFCFTSQMTIQLQAILCQLL